MDGTRVERFSTGERNAQELAFDAFGNLFSMDNDGDYPGEKERALYITEGSEHGWRFNWQWLRKQTFTKISGIDAYNPWMEEGLFLPDRDDHAAYLTPTLGNSARPLRVRRQSRHGTRPGLRRLLLHDEPES